MGNLYQSIDDLNVTFIQPSTSKDPYLKPKVQQLCSKQSNLLPIDGLSGAPAVRRFYKCSSCNMNVTDTRVQGCPSCNYQMVTEVSFTGSEAAMNINEGGFVKGVVSYMVMDNLEVKPLSSISIVNLLKKLNIQQVGSLDEKVVELGMEEGLNLLKASLQSEAVLTSVFLGA